ncbi:MAG: 50S ribosomal protein L29 [Pseudomonadota bacterium]
MIPKEIKQRTDDELVTLEKTLSDDLFNAKIQNATGHPDMGKIRKIRKDIARVKTIIRERALGVSSSKPVEAEALV